MAEQNPNTASAAQWHPPVALWQTYLLIVLTLSFYVVFWGLRLARDLRRNLDGRIRPVWYGAGLLIPVVSLFVTYRQARQIRRSMSDTGLYIGPAPLVILGFHVCIFGSFNIIDNVFDSSRVEDEILLALLYLLTFPIPWLFLQRQINHLGTASPNRVWNDRPSRFTGRQYAAMACGLGVYVLTALGLYVSTYERSGIEVPAGQVVSSPSGLYTVTASDERWHLSDVGSGETGADLTLHGSATGTTVTGVVNCSSDTGLDGVVEERRGLIGQRLIALDEERVMLDGSFQPVSYARYVAEGEQIWWVATVHSEGASIEVVGVTAQASGEEAAVAAMVKSLRLTQESKQPCGSS